MNLIVKFELLLALVETGNQAIIKRLIANNELKPLKYYENNASNISNINLINNPFWFIAFLKDTINIR